MAEKLAEVYEQYDMEILSSQKGRGATILNTSKGLRILEPFRSNVTRLEQEYVLKRLLVDRGYENIDAFVPNVEGRLLTYDKYRQPFVMKLHFEGEECDMHKTEDIIRAISALAKFHIYGRDILDDFETAWRAHLEEKEQHRIEEIKQAIENGEELEKLSSLYEINGKALEKILSGEEFVQDASGKRSEERNKRAVMDAEEISKQNNSVEQIFKRHNQEIKKIYRFIYRVKRKNEFENIYLKVYEQFYDKGRNCLDMLSKMPLHQTRTKDNPINAHYGICHGGFNQHNVILGSSMEAIVHFERFSKGNQLNDLYQFARKVMEKNHFDYELLQLIFHVYEEHIPLSQADYQYMYILFSYPEKFWKIANSYYNTNKAFLSPKYIEKLETVILQEEEKQALLKAYREKNNLFI